MMQRTNGLSHYHGTLDGLDILSARPEYTDFTENGRTFVALDREPDPITPQSWWQQNKWFFYGSGLTIVGLILLCTFGWICTCANCCIPKFIFSPCIVCFKQSRKYKRNLKIHRNLNKQSLNEVESLARDLLLQSLPNSPIVQLPIIQSVNETPIHIHPNQAVLYRPTPTLQEIQAAAPIKRRSNSRSLSESSKKPCQLRVFV